MLAHYILYYNDITMLFYISPYIHISYTQFVYSLHTAQYTPTVACTGTHHRCKHCTHAFSACPHDHVVTHLCAFIFCSLDLMSWPLLHTSYNLYRWSEQWTHSTGCKYRSHTHTRACVPHTVCNMLAHLDSAEKESVKSLMIDRTIIITLGTG